MGSFYNSVFQIFFILMLMFLHGAQAAATTYFNVLKFGATADGKRDISKALNNAWEKACQSEGISVVLIPRGTYLLRPIIFQGPCKGPIALQVKGILKAPVDKASLNSDHWITFRYIDRLQISGGGSFDGQGASVWPYNTCKNDNICPTLPVSIRFDFITNSVIHRITSINSKNFHFNIFSSSGMRFENIKILAPGDSPNTDGIHLADSTNIRISNSIIATGDDCVSIGPGSKNITITKVRCGPGHGFSIGSLGGTPNEGDVSGVIVRNCSLIGTLSGLRIKTKASSYPSTVSDITFERIHVDNVNNPIIIDQSYCPSENCGQQEQSKVRIQGARFRNIWGTSSSKIAVSLQCSSSTPCQKIELRDINIDYNGTEGKGAISSCSNVRGVAYGRQKPSPCV